MYQIRILKMDLIPFKSRPTIGLWLMNVVHGRKLKTDLNPLALALTLILPLKARPNFK